MADVYKIIDNLLKEHGISGAKMSSDLGMSRSFMTELRKGRAKSIKAETAQKIAEYFGVSVSYLLGIESKETAPTSKAEYLIVSDNAAYADVETSTDSKNALPLSDEALKLARQYDSLTDHGRGAVNAILQYESESITEKETAPKSETSAVSPVLKMPKAKRRRDGFVEIKVYDQPAAAGLGNYLDEPDHHIEQYPIDIIPQRADFGILISGNSMEPEIHDGGTAFVQSCVSIDSGQIGIFVLNGQAYCKRLFVDHENRQIRLVSANKNYEDIVVHDHDSFRTVGLVLGQWVKKYTQG